MTSSSNDFFNLDFEYQDIVDGREWMDVPEQRLIWAIIERSVRDALGNQASDAMTAIDWLWSEDQEITESFSFQWCCETLGISPNVLREKILKTREQMHKSPLDIPEGFERQAA